MRCPFRSCLAAFFLAAPALGQAGPATAATAGAPATASVQPDLSSPRAALLSIYGALQAGDLAAARECLVFPDAAHAELFDIINAQTYEPLKLMRGLEARFGPTAGRPFAYAPLERALNAALEKSKTVTIHVEGDTAAVVDKKAAVNPSDENELTGIRFQRQGDGWKIVAGTFGDIGDVGEMPAPQLRLMRAMRNAISAACQATSQRLQSGGFKNADEAFADYQSRVQSGMQTALAAAATTQK